MRAVKRAAASPSHRIRTRPLLRACRAAPSTPAPSTMSCRCATSRCCSPRWSKKMHRSSTPWRPTPICRRWSRTSGEMPLAVKRGDRPGSAVGVHLSGMSRNALGSRRRRRAALPLPRRTRVLHRQHARGADRRGRSRALGCTAHARGARGAVAQAGRARTRAGPALGEQAFTSRANETELEAAQIRELLRLRARTSHPVPDGAADGSGPGLPIRSRRRSARTARPAAPGLPSKDRAGHRVVRTGAAADTLTRHWNALPLRLVAGHRTSPRALAVEDVAYRLMQLADRQADIEREERGALRFIGSESPQVRARRRSIPARASRGRARPRRSAGW